MSRQSNFCVRNTKTHGIHFLRKKTLKILTGNKGVKNIREMYKTGSILLNVCLDLDLYPV